MSEPHNVVESLRDVVQDILAPDMKATRMSVEAIHSEVSSIRAEMKLRDEKMTQLVHSGDDKLEILILSGDRELNQLINNGIERNAKDIQRLSEKLDLYIDIRERLATWKPASRASEVRSDPDSGRDPMLKPHPDLNLRK